MVYTNSTDLICVSYAACAYGTIGCLQSFYDYDDPKGDGVN